MNAFCNHYLQILSLEYFSYGRTIEEKKKQIIVGISFQKKKDIKSGALR